MKMEAVKQDVFSLSCTSSTKQLKKQRQDLTAGRDLRYKVQWIEILQQLKKSREDKLDISIEELKKSEQMLKDSLFKIGSLAGLKDEQIDIDWQRIKLEAHFADIHIEEL